MLEFLIEANTILSRLVDSQIIRLRYDSIKRRRNDVGFKQQK